MFLSNKQYQSTAKKAGKHNQRYTDWLDDYMVNNLGSKSIYGSQIPDELDEEEDW